MNHLKSPRKSKVSKKSNSKTTRVSLSKKNHKTGASLKTSRDYDNSARKEKSLTNKQLILEQYVNLLAEKKGAEISLDELAEKSNLSTRTLFRFFGDKKTLALELEKYLEQYLISTTGSLSLMTIEDFAEQTFKVFDQYENLIQAYLYTNLGQTSRTIFRKKFNALLAEKLKQQLKLTSSQVDQNKILFIATLINANIWNDFTQLYKKSGQEMSSTVRWAIKTLMSNI